MTDAKPGQERDQPDADPPGAPPRRTETLTARETEVVRLVAEGYSNERVGELLFVSPRTVQSHVASALRKTGAANRTQLGVLAVREGIVPLDPGAPPPDP